MSDSIPGKSDTELSIEAFVDSMLEIHPNLDREEFRDTITTCVHDALGSVNGEEEPEEGEESDDDKA